MKLKIGVGQMSSRNDKEENIAVAERLIDEMAASGARIACLPEYSVFIGEPFEVRQTAETLEGPTMSRLRAKAKALGIYLNMGSMPECEGDLVYNTSVVIDPQGDIIAAYRKIHLFDVVLPDGSERKESKAIASGSEVVTADIDGVIFGMSICYDMRFPELYNRLTRMGAEVLFIPAAFTLPTGRDHWHLLLRARAVDNLCWVAAAAQYGEVADKKVCYGRSLIIDPWGTVVAQCVDGVGVAISEIDLERLRNIRKTFPVLEHHRPDIITE